MANDREQAGADTDDHPQPVGLPHVQPEGEDNEHPVGIEDYPRREVEDVAPARDEQEDHPLQEEAIC